MVDLPPELKRVMLETLEIELTRERALQQKHWLGQFAKVAAALRKASEAQHAHAATLPAGSTQAMARGRAAGLLQAAQAVERGAAKASDVLDAQTLADQVDMARGEKPVQ